MHQIDIILRVVFFNVVQDEYEVYVMFFSICEIKNVKIKRI